MIKQETIEDWMRRLEKRKAEERAKCVILKAQINALEPSKRTQAIVDMVKMVDFQGGVIFGPNGQDGYNRLFSVAQEVDCVDLHAVVAAMHPKALPTIQLLYGYRP